MGYIFDLEFVHLCWTWDHEFDWKKSCQGLEISQFHNLHHILFFSCVHVWAHHHEWLTTTTTKKKNKKRRNHWWRFESCSFSLSLPPSNLFFSCFYVFDHHEWLKKKKKKNSLWRIEFESCTFSHHAFFLFMCYLRSWIVDRKSYKGWNLAAPSLHPILVRVWDHRSGLKENVYPILYSRSFGKTGTPWRTMSAKP